MSKKSGVVFNGIHGPPVAHPPSVAGRAAGEYGAAAMCVRLAAAGLQLCPEFLSFDPIFCSDLQVL